MDPESENFENLQKLLTLKRHEQPPPGYFNRFSGQVIARIEAGETGDVRAGFWTLFGEAGWIQRFWAALDARPVLAGAVGVAICGVFATGVILSESADAPMAGLNQSQAIASAAAPASPFENPLVPGNPTEDFSSTMGLAPATQPAGSIFDNVQPPLVRPATFNIRN